MAMIILLCSALAAYAVHLIRGGRWCGRAATGLAIAAWGTLTGQLVKRGLKAGHWPLTNRYEFALCFVWAVVAVYLLLEASWHADRGERGDRHDPQRQAGVPVLAMALLVATYAVTRPAGEQAIVPLSPVLRSVWLQVHVLTAVVAYGAFGVAAGLALTQWIGPALSFDLGAESLESLLGLGPQGDLGADHLAVGSLDFARASAAPVAWTAAGGVGRDGLWVRPLYVHRRPLVGSDGEAGEPARFLRGMR
jgi:ABC-type transport system involved in cytochrome c biogenesis permease subunit